jgi:hypothetical protein
MRSELARLCKAEKIPIFEIHADRSHICIVTTNDEKESEIQNIAKSLIARLEAPPPAKFALSITGCHMLAENDLKNILSRLGNVLYLNTKKRNVTETYFKSAFALVRSSELAKNTFPLTIKYKVNQVGFKMLVDKVELSEKDRKDNKTKAQAEQEWKSPVVRRTVKRQQKKQDRKTALDTEPRNRVNRYKILSRDNDSSNHNPNLTATCQLIPVATSHSSKSHDKKTTSLSSDTAAPSAESLDADMDAYKALRDLKTGKLDALPDTASSLVDASPTPRTPETHGALTKVNGTGKRTKINSASRGKNKKKPKNGSTLSSARDLPFSQSPPLSDDDASSTISCLNHSSSSSSSSSDSDEDDGAQTL